MAHPRSMDILDANPDSPNAGAQFKQNPRSLVKKRLSPGFMDAV